MNPELNTNVEPIDPKLKWSTIFKYSSTWESWGLREDSEESKSILIVEDDTTTIRLFKAMLKITDESVRIKSLKSAEEAEKYLNHLRANSMPGPDIALVDFKLRAKDGLYVCGLLDFYFPMTKIVMISAMNPLEVRKEMEKHHLKVELIPKPVSRDQLSILLRS